MNSLEKMVEGLRLLRKFLKKREDLKLKDNLVVISSDTTWNNHVLRFAKFLMFSDEFVKLSLDEKKALAHLVMTRSVRVERMLTSVLIFGEQSTTEGFVVVDDDNYTILDHLVPPSATNQSTEVIKEVYTAATRKMAREMTKAVFDTQLTETEEAYLLCQLIFHVEASNLSDNTLEASVRFRNSISNDIHEYYIERGISNYATRLIQIMDVMHQIENTEHEAAKVIEMAKLFDVIKFEGEKEGFKEDPHNPFFYRPQ